MGQPRLWGNFNAVPVCGAWIVGSGLILIGPAAWVIWAALIASVTLASILLCVRRRREAFAAVVLLIAAVAGAMATSRAASAAAQRQEQWFPGGSGSREIELVGRLPAAAQVGLQGRRHLNLDAETSAAVPRGARVALVVAPSSAEANARVDRLRAGDRLRVWCRLRRDVGYEMPGARDPRWFRAAAGVSAGGAIKSGHLVERLPPSSRFSLARVIDGLRVTARQRLGSFAERSSVEHQVLGAILLGDRRGLEPQVLRRWRHAGISHLVAISGLHVGVVLTTLLFGLRTLGLRAVWRIVVTTLALVQFAMLVGGAISVVRAVAGAATCLVVRRLGRDTEPLNDLALLVLVLLLCRPLWLMAVGFQFSVVACAGLVLWARRIAESLPLPRWIAMTAGASIAVYAATFPLSAYYFNLITPGAVLVNLLAVPLSGLMLVSGYLALLFGELPWIGAGFAELSCSLARLLDRLAEAASDHFAALTVAAPQRSVLMAYYASATAWVLLDKLRAWRSTLTLRLSLLVGALAGIGMHAGPLPTGPVAQGGEVALLDVGQGQSLALRDPSGRVALVDCGGSFSPRFDPGERLVLPFLLRWSGRRIDLLVLSHGDLDHSGGAAALLRRLEVGRLWLGPGFHKQPRMRELFELAQTQGTAVQLVRQGSAAELGRWPVEVLAPTGSGHPTRRNDGSVVVRVGTAPTRLLALGDLEARGVSQLLSQAPDSLRAEGVVLAHHGSRSGTSAALLERVAPEVALVSAGRGNRFGHPHRETVRRVLDRGIPLWRTDRHGLVLVHAGAAGWEVKR